MAQPTLDDLLKAGVHFGHQTRRWNPKMRRFIFAERNGIHIIDLQKTLRQIELAQKLAREVILKGEQILFVCTKQQLAEIVKAEADRCGAMWVTERWLGGLLTNFSTIKKQIKKLKDLEAGSEAGAAARALPGRRNANAPTPRALSKERRWRSAMEIRERGLPSSSMGE